MFPYLRRHDWLLNIALGLLAAASLLMISSVSPKLFYQQLVWFLISFAVIIGFSLVDWRVIVNYRWIIFGFYFTVIVLLLATLLFAPPIRHIRGWLVLGPLQFQSSELAKVALIFLLAYFFAKRHIGIAHLANLAVSFIYFLMPALIVFLQPDWGSALVLLGIWMGFLLVSGVKWKHLGAGILLLIVFGFLSWNFLLKGYQKERILGFLQPSYDPLGVNYSVIQSKIAIGSAGLFGKGFRQGTQVQLGFLPEPANDFIFAAFIEEWGFVGGLFVTAIFSVILARIIAVGLKSENNFVELFCLVTAILFLLEFILNVGSNIGFSPVVGVTLPFFSYGGSSLLTKAMLIGIIQGMRVRSGL